MARVSDAIMENLPCHTARTPNQTRFAQVYGTLGDAVGQKAGFMAATEAAVVEWLGLPAGTKVDLCSLPATVDKAKLAANGTVNWAALLAFLEQLWTTLGPILIPLL